MVLVGEIKNLLGLANILGCRVGSFPLTYQGLPLGSTFTASNICKSYFGNDGKTVSEVEKLYMSKGGRVTLSKSNLSSIPTYFMSLFMPTHVANKLEKLQRDFLWSGIGDTKKFHWVDWRLVCSPLKEGVLGIRKLSYFNQALLGKWLRQFGVERDYFWRRVIYVKYGEGRGVGQWSKSGVHIRLAYGKVFIGVGILCPNSYGLRFEMDPV